MVEQSTHQMRLAVVARLYLQYRQANLIQTLQMSEALGELTPTTLITDKSRNDYFPGRQSFPEVLSELGIAQTMRFVHFYNPLYFIAGSEALRKKYLVNRSLRFLKSHKFEAVFTRFEAFGIAASRIFPTILELHDITNIEDPHGLQQALLQQNLKILCISENLKKLLNKRGFPEEKMLVAHDGVNLAKFQQPDLEPLFSSPKKVVGYAGHLYPDRGILMIIAAAAANQDLEFHLAGGNAADVGKYRREAKAQNLTNIVFYGNLPHRQIPAFLASCDYLIMPYSKTLNTFDSCSPLKVFEYMAMGKVIITADLPTIGEVLSQRNALIFEADNQAQFQQHLSRLRSGEVDEQTLAENARRDVQQYSWRKRAQMVLSELAQMASQQVKSTRGEAVH